MKAALFRKGSQNCRIFPNPINHIGCTIRAYPAHAAELNNPPPESVHFFYKNGRSCAYPLKDGGIVPVPTRFGDVVHEIEVCLLLGETPLPSPLGDAKYDPVAVKRSIVGIGLGLDWTIRSIQQPLAKQGLPWERSKAFERSAAFTDFMELPPATEAEGKAENILFAPDLDPVKFPTLKFALLKNGQPAQDGNTDNISFCPIRQTWEMHRVTRLNPGDVVMTGTTTGVNSVTPGDKLQLVCDRLGINVNVQVVPEEEVEK